MRDPLLLIGLAAVVLVALVAEHILRRAERCRLERVIASGLEAHARVWEATGLTDRHVHEMESITADSPAIPSAEPWRGMENGGDAEAPAAVRPHAPGVARPTKIATIPSGVNASMVRGRIRGGTYVQLECRQCGSSLLPADGCDTIALCGCMRATQAVA